MKLNNQEIWLAYPNLLKLSKVTFPVKISLGIASIINRLQRPYLIIERERTKLVNKYGTLSEDKKTMKVDLSSDTAGDYSREFAELLTTEWSEDLQVERVVIPSAIPGKCEICGKKGDIMVLIEPQILMPLVEHFVSVV